MRCGGKKFTSGYWLMSCIVPHQQEFWDKWKSGKVEKVVVVDKVVIKHVILLRDHTSDSKLSYVPKL
jgi:hypothetical protein